MEANNNPTTANSWNPAEVRMSFFMKPITNKWPNGQPLSLFQVYRYIITRRYMSETEQLRGITDDDKARDFKGHHFDYVTPSGVFSYCSDNSLVKHSGVLCMDLDHLGNRVEELFQLLIHEPMFQTLLLFRSPRGSGLKWFIHIDLSRCDHRTWFQAVRNYLMHTYHLEDKQVDKACGNPSRACYLCYDPQAYILLSLVEYF
jgi:hypothetical protein